MKIKKKIEPWRIIVGSVAIAYIVFLWTKNDIATLYINMADEEIVLMVVTTIFVSLFKIVSLVGVLLLMKWIISKIKK